MMKVNGSRIGQLKETIAAEMAKWEVPGLTIGILDGDNVEVDGFGTANVETGVAVTPDTLFQIGSISKIFTTTLIMTLVDEGKIDLDTPVITYVPTLPLADEAARKSITIRHLLTHMSGFYGDRFDDQGRGDDAIAKAVAAFGDLRQQTAPGELWTYCNAGFDLAGRAAELVTGKGFEALMRERVFGPLGMARATYFPDEAILHAVAVGHQKAEGSGSLPAVSSPWPIPRRSNPAGGVSTTVGELLRFAKMHIQLGELDGNRVLSRDSATAMQERQTEADPFRTWGIGWSRREIDGVQIIEHNGATNGFTARLTIVPSRRFAIALFTNHNDGSPAHSKISEVALDRFFGLASKPLEIISLTDDKLTPFAGIYIHDLLDYTLSVENGGFNVSRIHRNPFDGSERPEDPFVLRPVTEQIFKAEGGGLDGSLADFILDGNGKVRFFRFGGRLGYPVTNG
jgi:CubicO group peptidase (beta-lactamase class C family)